MSEPDADTEVTFGPPPLNFAVVVEHLDFPREPSRRWRFTAAVARPAGEPLEDPLTRHVLFLILRQLLRQVSATLAVAMPESERTDFRLYFEWETEGSNKYVCVLDERVMKYLTGWYLLGGWPRLIPRLIDGKVALWGTKEGRILTDDEVRETYLKEGDLG